MAAGGASEHETGLWTRIATLELRVAALARAEQASRAFAEIGRELAGTLDVEQTMRRIVEVVVEYFQTPRVNLFRLDEAEQMLTCVASAGLTRDDQWLGRRFTLEQGTAGRAVRERRPVYVADVLGAIAVDEVPGARAWFEANGLRSALAVPLVARGDVLGALVLADRPERAYPERELDLVSAFAAHAALALANARLFAASEQRRRAAESLLELGRMVSRSLEPRELTQQIVRSVRELLGVPFAILYQVQPDAGHLTRVAVAGGQAPFPMASLALGTGVVGLAVEQRRAVFTPDILNDRRIRLPAGYVPDDARWPLRAILAVPLIARDAVVGALAVGRPRGEVFTEEQTRLTQLFADQAALALANAGLLERAAERARKLTALSALVQHITSAADRDAVFQAIGDAAVRLLGAKAALVWVDDPAAHRLRRAATSSGDAATATALTRVSELPYANTLSGIAFQSRTPTYAFDVQQDARWHHPAVAREADVRACAAIPMITQEGAVGSLAILFGVQRQFTAEEDELMRLLADHAALAIERRRNVERQAPRHPRALEPGARVTAVYLWKASPRVATVVGTTVKGSPPCHCTMSGAAPIRRPRSSNFTRGG